MTMELRERFGFWLLLNLPWLLPVLGALAIAGVAAIVWFLAR